MAITVKHSKVSTIPDADDTSLVRPSDWNADHTLTGLGTMAEQDSNNVNITGGSITGVTGLVTSVGITSSATSLAITNTPITSSGNIGVNFAGIANQYVRGDGTLANFPTTTGGGSSVSYYLNGSVNQGTFGGNVYYEMNKTPVFGAGTNFSINANGYIAQFITDANDPSLLAIPAGSWNCELYFSTSSAGGNPNFYLELYKYNGTTFTLIASSSASPEDITGGVSKDLYVTALSVPATTLAVTDRLAIRVYVNHSGRTITLHTEDNNLCQVITTFSTGLNALNGLTAQVQYFATGTTGSDFNISSVTDTHTFNLPSASSLNRGLLTSADWTTFNGKVTSVSGTGTVNGITLSGTVTSTGNITLGGTLSGVSLTTQVSGTLPVANGGTGATTLTGLVVGNGTSAMTTVTAPSGTVVGTSDTQTLTNKTVVPRVSSTTSISSPLAWNSDNFDVYVATAQAGALTISADSGTGFDGEKIIFRFTCDATPRVITFTGGTSKGFKPVGVTLTTSGSNFTYTLTASKTTYFGAIYNTSSARWEIVALSQEV